MKENDQNNKRGWSAEVDELESMEDGKNPVNSGSWQKLESRLVNKTRGKRVIFYWVAAATIVSLLLIRFGTHLFSEKGSKKEQFYQQSFSTSVPAKNIAPVIKFRENKENSKKKTVSGTSIDERIVVPLPTPDTTMMKEMLTIKQPDTISAVVVNDNAVPPVKKTMGILHLNDLTDSIETSPGTTMRMKPLRRFIRGSHDDDTENAAATDPVKKHTINKPSTIQN